MKKFSKSIALGLAVTSILSSSTTVFASDKITYKENIIKLEQEVEQEINEYLETISANNDYVEFANATYTINEEYLLDKGIPLTSEAVLSEITNNFETMVKEATVEYIEDEYSLNPRATETRYAAVWSGVPAIGVNSYVKQKYEATYSNGKFTDIELIGDSYQTGWKIGAWSHIDSWAEFNSIKTEADIRMEGVIDYTLGAGLITTEATFKYTDNQPK